MRLLPQFYGKKMTIDFSDPLYYFFPLAGGALFVALYFLLRHRSARTQNAVLFALLAINFALHFLKLLFPPYSTAEPEDALQKITAENICAINTMIFPFFFLKKNGVGCDFMFYVGLISGIAACWMPESIEDCTPFDFDCIRYYYCHTVLWVVPLLMVIFRLHRLNYRRIIFVPLIYILELMVIVFNEVALVALGLDEQRYLLSVDHGNGGLAFGPYSELEGTAALDILLTFVPPFFRPSEQNPHYAPALWQLFPVVILGCPLGFLMCLYWEYKHFYSDLRRLFLFISGPFTRYRFGRGRIKFCGAERGAARVRRTKYRAR